MQLTRQSLLRARPPHTPTYRMTELGCFEEVRDGVPLKFRVYIVPERLMDAVAEHMLTAYLPREPMAAYLKLHEDPETRRVHEVMWKGMMSQGAAMVALKEGPGAEAGRIVGANMTYVAQLHDSKPEIVKGSKLEPMFDVVMDIAKKSRIFEKYGVDKYLSAFGLSVDPKYHGYKIGERLLQCRKPLAKHLGIKVTTTLYTNVISQHISKKVGFVVIYEGEFSKLKHNGVEIFKGMPGKFEESAWDFS